MIDQQFGQTAHIAPFMAQVPDPRFAFAFSSSIISSMKSAVGGRRAILRKYCGETFCVWKVAESLRNSAGSAGVAQQVNLTVPGTGHKPAEKSSPRHLMQEYFALINGSAMLITGEHKKIGWRIISILN
ncbi:hypothetical protein [Altererythrobacter sp. Root672]|uniref:hypothetical protein n=1 Tax=Altererythrobacter sp. Root672 TaxID=1736584 RepID=UPI0012E36D1E|nr:hypothetical protein [Altererythrobacter sp. Root672]